MQNLTNAQLAVINSNEAMTLIAAEAKQALATKFNTTLELVEQAFEAGNANITKMMAELICTGINECAKLVK